MAAGWLTPETPPPLPPNLFLAITVSQAPIHDPHARRTCARKQNQANARVQRKRRGEKGAVNNNLRWWNRKVFQAHTCVQKYAHSHTHTHLHTQPHTLTKTHTHMHTHTCTRTHTHQHPPRANRRSKRRLAQVRFHTHARKVTHTPTHTRAPGSSVREVSMSAAFPKGIHTFTHPQVHTCTHTHMHAYTHTHIHAYTHTRAYVDSDS